MKIVLFAMVLAAITSVAANAFAHSGGTDARGCHLNHKTGVYHCH